MGEIGSGLDGIGIITPSFSLNSFNLSIRRSRILSNSATEVPTKPIPTALSIFQNNNNNNNKV